jgi:hypothetical protein
MARAAHQQRQRVTVPSSRVCSSKDSCQWSRSPASGLVWQQLEALLTRCGEHLQARHLVEPAAAVGRQRQRRMRVAPGLTVSMRPSRSNTITPAVSVVEDGLQVARVRPRPAATLRCTSSRAFGQLLGHVGERSRQAAELVARGEHRLGTEVAAATWRTPSASSSSGSRELVAQQDGQQHRAEHRQDQRQGQRADVHAAQAVARQARCWYSR